jgi:hypothetical protein
VTLLAKPESAKATDANHRRHAGVLFREGRRMAQHINAASRLHAILSKASKAPDGNATVDVWASVLEIQVEDAREKAVKVIESLLLLDEELRAVAEQMQRSSFSESQYKSDIHRIRQCLNPMILPNQWQNARTYLTERTLYALGFWSEYLPDEEDVIDASELAKLLADIEQLEASVDNAAIPDILKDLIRRHLTKIRLERLPNTRSSGLVRFEKQRMTRW